MYARIDGVFNYKCHYKSDYKCHSLTEIGNIPFSFIFMLKLYSICFSGTGTK